MNSSAGDDRKLNWARLFEKGVDPKTVHDLVLELVEASKFEDAICCIEQAILSGQIQPWMHQVLALSMQAAGRPKSQIERVLLSSQDLVSNDFESLMTLAAYMVRFGELNPAIDLCRQAAAIDPTRPEPYVMALETAARAKNYTAVAWSAPEVLSYSWSRGRETMNRLAERSATEAIDSFVKNTEFSRAFNLLTAMKQARRLDLVVRLEWNGQGDLDLKVIEPNRSTCSVTEPTTPGGGIFVHDGFGPNQQNCYEEYLCPLGLPGDYRIVVTHVSGNIVGKRARLLIIRDRGTAQEETVSETIFLGPNDQTIRFSLSGGRRQATDAVQHQAPAKSDAKVKSPSAALAQLGNAGGSGQIGVGLGQIGGGGRAIGYAPTVTTVNEGVQLGAMAIVSGDRRYVRINVNPVFSSITDVFSFTFAR